MRLDFYPAVAKEGARSNLSVVRVVVFDVSVLRNWAERKLIQTGRQQAKQGAQAD
jgi:hypothetical protein